MAPKSFSEWQDAVRFLAEALQETRGTVQELHAHIIAQQIYTNHLTMALISSGALGPEELEKLLMEALKFAREHEAPESVTSHLFSMLSLVRNGADVVEFPPT